MASANNFPTEWIQFELSDADEALADELNIAYADRDSLNTTLRFVLDGRVEASGTLENFTMSPAPSDMSPKLEKYALKLSGRVIRNAVNLPARSLTRAVVQAHELLAEWHITRDRIEEGIAEYQKILDSFPSLKRWDFYEKQIHEQLGIKHDHLASTKRKYRLGIKTCDASKINAAQGHVLSSRIHSQGMRALPIMVKEITKACKKAPNFGRIEKSLVRVLASRAGDYNDCALVERYEAKWITLGGSQKTSAKYRSRHSCP